jgi:hypothetical protein
MCDYRGKLIAGLDRELAGEEAADVEAHVQTCKECRRQVAVYEQVSRTFDAYCDAALAAKTPHRMLRWVPALPGAVVAAAALFLAFPRARVELAPVHAPAHASIAAAIAARELAPEPVPGKKIHKQRGMKFVPDKTLNWSPADAAVQIAIPAEAMFPPGVVPEGMNLIAELSIAPDGSVERLLLRP